MAGGLLCGSVVINTWSGEATAEAAKAAAARSGNVGHTNGLLLYIKCILVPRMQRIFPQAGNHNPTVSGAVPGHAVS
jgi:hypothetical protein